MAAGYVDDHKLILYRDGTQPRDITAFASDMTLTDDLDTLAAELTFKTFISPWDKYTPKLALAPGDKVRVTNQGKTVFSGVIITVTLDGGVTAYDRGCISTSRKSCCRSTTLRPIRSSARRVPRRA